MRWGSGENPAPHLGADKGGGLGGVAVPDGCGGGAGRLSFVPCWEPDTWGDAMPTIWRCAPLAPLLLAAACEPGPDTLAPLAPETIDEALEEVLHAVLAGPGRRTVAVPPGDIRGPGGEPVEPQYVTVDVTEISPDSDPDVKAAQARIAQRWNVPDGPRLECRGWRGCGVTGRGNKIVAITRAERTSPDEMTLEVRLTEGFGEKAGDLDITAAWGYDQYRNVPLEWNGFRWTMKEKPTPTEQGHGYFISIEEARQERDWMKANHPELRDHYESQGWSFTEPIR